MALDNCCHTHPRGLPCAHTHHQRWFTHQSVPAGEILSQDSVKSSKGTKSLQNTIEKKPNNNKCSNAKIVRLCGPVHDSNVESGCASQRGNLQLWCCGGRRQRQDRSARRGNQLRPGKYQRSGLICRFEHLGFESLWNQLMQSFTAVQQLKGFSTNKHTLMLTSASVTMTTAQQCSGFVSLKTQQQEVHGHLRNSRNCHLANAKAGLSWKQLMPYHCDTSKRK